MSNQHKTTPWRSQAFDRQPHFPPNSWRVREAFRTNARRAFRWFRADHFHRKRRPEFAPLGVVLWDRQVWRMRRAR